MNIMNIFKSNTLLIIIQYAIRREYDEPTLVANSADMTVSGFLNPKS